MQIVISNELLLVIAIALVLIIILVVLIPAARGKPAPPHEGEPIVVEFPDKHVQVTVPWQGYAVKVLRIPYSSLAEMPPIKLADKYDWPHHVWLNVVVARADNPDTLVTQFDPKLELRLGYSAEDQARSRVAGFEQPVFGFWDGCQWVLFTKEKHDLSDEPSSDQSMSHGASSHESTSNPTDDVVGYAVVKLAAWSDPTIAGGP